MDKFKSQLTKWCDKNGMTVKKTSPKKKKKLRNKPQKSKSERLSEREWKDIMGTNQRGLKRGKGGAWK